MEHQLHAEREEMTVVDVFRSQDGRVFVNVNRDGVQLAHLVAGESFVIPDARSEMATTKPFGYFDKDEKKLYPTKAAADLMGCLESDLLPLYAAPQVPGSSPREAKVSSVTQGQETRAAPPAVAAPLSAIATTTVEHIPEYFDKPGVLDGLSQAHPVLLIRQMANEIARLRALPSATGMREGLEELSLMAAYSNADPTIEELERILDAIGNRVEVLLNGLDSSGAKDG
jgi:hypothetical protein